MGVPNNSLTEKTNYKESNVPASQKALAAEWNELINAQKLAGKNQGEFDEANIVIQGTGTFNNKTYNQPTLTLIGGTSVTTSGENTCYLQVTFSQQTTVTFAGTITKTRNVPISNIYAIGTYDFVFRHDNVNSAILFDGGVDAAGGGSGGGPELNTWYVNDSGSDSNDGSPQTPFLTVQKALDVAAEFDIINIASGTYSENLVIEKSIKFEGYPDAIVQCNTFTVDTTSGNIDLRVSGLSWYLLGSYTKNGTNDVSVTLLNNAGVGDQFSAFNFESLTVIDSKFIGYGASAHDSIVLENGIFQALGGLTVSSLEMTKGSDIRNNVITAGTIQMTNSYIHGDVTGSAILNNSRIGGTVSGTLQINRNPASQTYFENASTPMVSDNANDAIIEAYNNTGGASESRQTLTVTDANASDALVLAASTNIMKITLDAALTVDWTPATITGWVEGRSYLFEIIKNSDNAIDLTTARAVPNVGYDDDIDPFNAMVYIDTTQKRAIISAVGFKSTFGQFGRMIITDSGYVE